MERAAAMPTPVHPQHSELRKDPWRGHWVIMAPGRAARPQPAFRRSLLDATVAGPFAAGQEDHTPSEVFAVRPDGGKANDATWRVRVVPNLYPALRVEHGPEAVADGPADKMAGLGAHEVIIEDPSKDADLTTMPVRRLTEVLWAWRCRLQDLRRDTRLACGIVFRHRGADAGATLAHPHSQLVALPFVPAALTTELQAAHAYRLAHGRCALCDVVRHERELRARVVFDGGGALAWAPFASRAPYELCVAPADHPHPFEDASEPVLAAVAATLKEALVRLDAVLNAPPYRLWLRNAPWRIPGEERHGHHWHISLLPITHQEGALEEATGVHINTLLPEDAAASLRGA